MDIKSQIDRYFKTKHILIDNKETKVHSGIGQKEFVFLYNLVLKNKITRAVEVGMAFGMSALAITTAFDSISKNNKNNKNNKNRSKPELISIDPFQDTQWENNGVKLLKQANLDKYHNLMKMKSYEALPKLLSENKKFQLVFIDGWHTFDYTLVDAFYADLITDVGGYIVIDDILHFSVKQCINYLDTNYKHWERVDSPNTFACYKKIGEDKREWNFHVKIK
jgi:predicted O-methyltransferase YrrM